MKALYYFTMVIAVAFLFSSCNRNNIAPENKSIDKLSVSNDFDWQTSANINFSITKDNSGVITITSEDGKTVYHKGYYNRIDPAYDVEVNIPKYVTRVLVNGMVVDINGTTVNVNLENKNQELKNSPQLIPSGGRIAYWRFNEKTGNTAFDSDGNSNGTISGADWTTGIYKSALDFDGTGGNVEIPSNNILNISGEKMSISLWFKKDSEDDDGTFIFCRTKYILRIDNHGKITFAVYTPQWNAVTIPWKKRIIDTDWHHLTATYNGKTLKIFVDTKLYAKREASGKIKLSSAPVYIGSENPVNYFNGTIDEVALYNKALSKTEIENIYTNTPEPDSGDGALVSWWKFNENSGTTANDSKGDNNGEIHGAKWTQGVEGEALSFDGINDYVIVPNAENFNVTKKITIMAWAKTEENKTAKIAEKGDWDGHSILQDHWNGWGCQIRTADNKSYSIKWGNGIPVFGEWYHIAMTYNGVKLKLYINGQLVKSKNVNGDLKVNNRDFAIGSNNGSHKFFHGCIDDVRFFNDALTQTQIQAIFKNQNNSGNSDADGDGVQDSKDDYPHDPARAFNNFFPAKGFGSLSFEDLWPGKGDYDFNDMVLDYRFTTVTNVSNKVVDIIGTFVIRAIGAGQSNGFGFQLPNDKIDADNIVVSGYDLRDNYITLKNNGLEAGQDKPTIIVFDDANEIMPPSGGFGVNVDPEKEFVDPDTITVTMTFTVNKYKRKDIDIIHFNPFLIVNKTRGKEIHLPGYKPTSLVDVSYFGTMDDNTNPGEGKYYKTVNNLPWAINITESFDYLTEKNEITTGYLKFYDWAASSGTLYRDWFKDKPGYRNKAVIYPARN
jgi:LruC domain-containing protein